MTRCAMEVVASGFQVLTGLMMMMQMAVQLCAALAILHSQVRPLWCS